MKQIKAIRGMNDMLPEQTTYFDEIENRCSKVFNQSTYRRISTPIVEKTELFARSIGAETDIVSKEMYTFEDRNGDMLTLRPEGTAGCVRAGIENGIFYNQQQRLWYSGPMFRHERPQKGRYRQFHQIGVEAYGWASPDIDAEIISISKQIWKALGINGVELQINSLGSSEARANYRDALVKFLSQFEDELDEDSQRRLKTNPLRILDSKNEKTQQILADAPILQDYLDDESSADFEQLKTYLSALNIPFTVNPKLVRGLDYYNKTVFEWVYPSLGAQATVCAGGRYDGMVEQLGGKSTPAIGFAIGVERLIEIVKDQGTMKLANTPDIYFISIDANTRSRAFSLTKELRDAGYSVQLHCGEGSLKNQIKKADKFSAKFAVILAEQEMNDDQVTIKPLLSKTEQVTVPQLDLTQTISKLLKI